VEKVAAPVPKQVATSATVGPVAWTLPEAGLALVVAFALLLGVQAVPGGFASAPVWAGITLLVYDVLLGCLLWFLARRRGSTIGAAYRLDVAPGLRAGLSTVGVAVGCWLFSVGYRAVAIGLGATPPISAGVDLTRMFGSGVFGAVMTIALVAVVGPLLEELLLRGVVVGAVARRFGVWPAILACSLAFALLHASLWSLLPLTVLGVGLGWLAARSRSLWPAVVAHILYNAVLVAAALYAAG
jgi:membrane protease YdiL (CAAX protease family)